MAVEKLASSSSSATLDAQLLLTHVLDVDRAYLFAHADAQITDQQRQTFLALFQRRLAGEPMAYILGHKEFWGLELIVTPDTLIPRPETELLVEAALAALPKQKQIIADLGTGSGAIALALASERPDWDIVASDQSAAAILVAKQNAENLKLNQICFSQGSWCEALGAVKYDAIISNPPYIEADDPHLSQGDLRQEPRSALASGEDGLDDIRTIISQAPNYLQIRGLLLLEHGYNQSAYVSDLLQTAGFAEIRQQQDLAGHVRITQARLA